MSHHVGDGRVKAKNKKTGEIVREFPHVIERSPWLEPAPSTRSKTTQTKQVTEPAKSTAAEKKEAK
ncbi:hypothetical protein ACFP47_10160 [Nesterenkonia lacusekhoensis]|uniref:Uncharacterized protein n=1 Tax=Nesterenkonia lacusekhoensis TaxID=150832 RepID=A0ABS4T524_9MICC|nr:hypothetical protein [Nesterenkonia lacusekhoensis]MBP2319564.1 hypothetical protein [Nesterenkonia lacusekhoensis]